MNNRFWQSEANKFTLYGAIFGLLFPIIATLLQAFLKHGNLAMSSLIDVQLTDPLLWIIDSAPFWLGLFARFAGRRQDNLKEIIRQSAATEIAIPEEPEDSQQFAGLLTFLGIGLIGIVLFGFSIWLQRLILSGDTPPAFQDTAISVDNSAAVSVANGGPADSQPEVPTATVAPIVINVQPTIVAPTFTSIPPTFTPLPTEAPTATPEPAIVVAPSPTPAPVDGDGNGGADASVAAVTEPVQSNRIILGFR